VLKDLLRRRVLAREVDSRVHVPQAEVVAACRRESQDGREVDVGHILVRGELEAARRKLNGLRDRIQGGEAFEPLALSNSEDPSVTDNKGRLGFISRGQFVKPFEDAAFGLPVGGVSEPVQTRFGLHLIKVFAERSRDRTDCGKLDDVTRQSLENKVYAQRREERLAAFLAQLKQQAEIRVHE
jgi:parvulin-like peptidyl-prolyl isomerase